MYLKSLEVQGFKSFANKINFKFHNGITGIVGPNGSGKSNVGDAIRWVLGEQSAKQLRGANMQDIIFAGTENRKPLGFAAVSITLDNADHKLPIDYEEVTVTRRVYRSGESEYLINGAACRLKDINELFYDTGIGKEGYSIIGQGQIDKILSGKPEERRELFDEAVGIVKYKRRKTAAQKKLDNERANLVRVNDILSELTKQLAPLERQSETARAYLKKKEELKVYDVNAFLMDLTRLKGQLSDVEEKLDISENDLSGSKAEYENAKQEYERIESEIEALSRQIEEARQQETRNQMQKQQLESQISILKEQIHAADTSKDTMGQRLRTIEQDLLQKEEQKVKEEHILTDLQEKLSLAEAAEADSRLESDAISANLSHLEQQIEAGKNEIIGLLNQRASVKGKLQRYETMLEQLQIRRAQVNQQILKLRSEETENEDAMLLHQSTYDDITQKIESLSMEAAGYEQKVTALQQELMNQNQKAEQGQTAYHREASRLESLINITERYDGYGNSIRRVMEQKDREPGIHGVVADLIKVEKSYETAVETALGGSIQNIVTEDQATAKRMIQFLKKNRFGRATFLPLDAVNSKGGFTNEKALNEPGIIGLASTLVTTDVHYQGLIQYLLGRTLVADNIDHAIAAANKYHHSLRIVTLEGESLSPGGSMTGGAFKNNSNLLGRRREIEELQESVTMLKKDLETLQSDIDENRQKRNVLRQKIVEINEKLQKEYLVQNTARMEIQQLEGRQNETKAGYGNLKQEIDDVEEQKKQLLEEKYSIEDALKLSETQEKELEDKISAWQKEQESERLTQEKQNLLSEKLHLELAGARQKDEFARQNLQRIRQEMKVLTEEKAQIQEGMDSNKDDIRKKEHDIEEIKKTIEASEHDKEQQKNSIGELQKNKEVLTEQNRTFFRRREELSDKMNALDKENYRLQAQKERLEESRESQINYMWEEYELTPNAALELRNEEFDDLSQMKKRVNELKSEIKGLGNVNVNAIEEFKEISERHTFLAAQHDDLINAEEALMGIIDELDKGMREQFSENFAKIQTEFDKAFKQLFGGGKGTLELVEDEDILEAGIRITSQPPGKKLQNMMQLSGGEKALTAIALLFAIQNLKPSPFCLLDEIEAALDESNVTRYAGYLNKLTKNTQFIIITHRRGTMAAADRLYGITMQEKGVSALVSVNLIEEQLDA